MYRKTEALVDLGAIRQNLAVARRLAPASRIAAVIKANAYGHGLAPVACALQGLADALAVASVDEALELRMAGIAAPLLVLEGACSRDAWREVAANSLVAVVNDPTQVDRLETAGLTSRVPVWVKVDTGMHRLGFQPSELRKVLARLQAAGADPQVVCTHLACADEPADEFTRGQIARFRRCMNGVALPASIANSAAILAWPDTHAEWNRPGYLLYGNSPMGPGAGPAGLRPAMTLRSEIIAIREVGAGEAVGYGTRWRAGRPSIVGTIAAGYADGYPRHAPDGTPILVGDRVCPLVGTVSMDMITVDLTDHGGAAVGDRVELWGRNVSVNEVASMAGTLGYELLTRVSPRVPRSYVDD